MFLRALRIALPLAALMAGAAHAQSAPPIKPGLWQIQSERELEGQKMPDMSEQLKNLPPEVRAQMKARGVDIGGGGAGGAQTMRVCLTKEQLAENKWQGDRGNCKTDVKERSAKSWKWHSVCTDPQAEGDGEALIDGPESYTVKQTVRMVHDGRPQTMRMTMRNKWLGADCGDVKPLGTTPKR